MRIPGVGSFQIEIVLTPEEKLGKHSFRSLYLTCKEIENILILHAFRSEPFVSCSVVLALIKFVT